MAGGPPGSSDGEREPTDVEGKALGEEELDFTDDERVVELGEGEDRYVVSSDSGSPDVPGGASDANGRDSDRGRPSETGERAPTSETDAPDGVPGAGGKSGARECAEQRPGVENLATARQTVANNLRQSGRAFGFDATLQVEGATSHHVSTSDDIETIARALFHRLASTVDDTTPEDEVLGILLLASGISVRYPTRAVVEYVRAHGLAPDDDIADLLEAIESDGGFRIPRETRPAESPSGDSSG